MRRESMQEPRRQNTRSALLQSAERLIAEKGLGSVSVKMITADAGARNPSAVHYHYGSIESLIKEVFATRFRKIENERAERLSRVTASDPDARLVALMEAAIGPLMETCLEEDGRLYVRFCQQFVADPRFDYALLMAESGSESILTLRDELLGSLTHVPPQKLIRRLRQGFVISIAQAVDLSRAIEEGMAPPIDEAIREGASCLAAYISAPV